MLVEVQPRSVSEWDDLDFVEKNGIAAATAGLVFVVRETQRVDALADRELMEFPGKVPGDAKDERVVESYQ